MLPLCHRPLSRSWGIGVLPPWPAMSCLGAVWLLLYRSAALFPNHGRIMVTQFSIGVGIPLTMFLLKARMCCCRFFCALCCTLLL